MSIGKVPVYILILVFLGISMAFYVVGGGLMAEHLLFMRDAEAVDAVVTEVRDVLGKDVASRDVEIRYEVEGETYHARLGAYASGWRQGQRLRVWYDKEHPERVRSARWQRASEILCGMGMLFLAVEVVLMAAYRRARNRADRT